MDLATRCRQQKVDHAGLASPDAAFSPGGHQGLFPVQAPASPTKVSPPGGDPWPRQFAYQDAKISVYQPELSDWTGNVLDAYSAVVIRTGTDNQDLALLLCCTPTQRPSKEYVLLQG